MNAELGGGDLGGFGLGEPAAQSSSEPQLNIRSSGRNKWGPANFTPPAGPQTAATAVASEPSYPSMSAIYINPEATSKC